MKVGLQIPSFTWPGGPEAIGPTLAHVARTNGVPYIAFRSLSDLAGATEFNADVGALFSSGLAESNEAAVTLAFLEAWKKRSAK